MLTNWMTHRISARLGGQSTMFAPLRSTPFRFALSAVCAAALAACGGSGPDSGVASSDSTASSKTLTAVQVSSTTTSSSAWTPAVNDTWQWQLRGQINTGYAVNVYDIDLFDAPQSTIDSLKAQGRHVVCYFSAGSSENWRPDFNQFLASDKGNALSGWAGERWLDTRSANVRQIMQKRLDLAKAKGCDGVEPDNVDGYTNDPGFPLNASTQLDYNRFLAAEAHARGLVVALKNDVEQVEELAAYFDFAINEQCHQYQECDVYTAFTDQGKPVFNAEYAKKYRDNVNGARTGLCQAARSADIRTLVLPLYLDDKFRYSCD